MAVCMGTGCSKDDLTPDPELNKSVFDSESAEAGSLGEMVNAFYEKYGSKILYDFKSTDMNFDWQTTQTRWYVPAVQDGDYIKRMITYLSESTFTDYPDSFVKKFLPSRIFLVDSICDRASYDASSLADIVEMKNSHAMVVAHVGTDMDDMDDSDWDNIKSGANTALMNSILSTTGVEPTDFNAMSEAYFMIDYVEDPEGEFTAVEYSCYSVVCVNAPTMEMWGEVYIMRPSDQQDFGYFVSFLMNTPKSKMDRVFARFPKVKKRAALAYEFMLENADTDLIEFQNQTCPDDKLPANYFVQ